MSQSTGETETETYYMDLQFLLTFILPRVESLTMIEHHPPYCVCSTQADPDHHNTQPLKH